MVINFLDTSAVLNGGLDLYTNCYISPITLMELENIKEGKDKDKQYKARIAVRKIINSLSIQIPTFSQWRINHILHKYNFLSNINDHLIIATAVLLAKQNKVYFITSDSAQFLFAKRIPQLTPALFENSNNKNEEYCGWTDYWPNDNELNLLYSEPENNILCCKTNEFAKVYVDGQLKDILFWNGERYRPIKYKDIKNPYLGETIRPRNTEQKMAFDLLQNQDIKVKLLTSAWGGGKTLMALNYALEQIAHGTYQKLVFVRNNIIAAGTNDIGYLPGDIRSKLSIFTRCIADHVGGEEKLEEMMDDRLVEAIPLSHVRGRSIRDSIVLCDECENMDDKLVTLLMSRIEADSEIIFCGDVAQIDSKRFEENNGIRSMIKHLSGDPLFGMIKLIKSERGPVPRLCDKMIPPI